MDTPQTNKPSRYRKYTSVYVSEDFSDEEMARDWTLSPEDLSEMKKYRKQAQLYLAIQLCCVKMYGRFIERTTDLSVRVISYLSSQLGLAVNLSAKMSTRKASHSRYRNAILNYLNFRKYDEQAQDELCAYLQEQSLQGVLPNELFTKAQSYLLAQQVLLPGHSVLDKLIRQIASQTHLKVFEKVYQRLPQNMLEAIDKSLQLQSGHQHTFFAVLKSYPPSASITSLKTYLSTYNQLVEMGIDQLKDQLLEPNFQSYLHELATKYSAKDLKRFDLHKRYALMTCFLLESRKQLLDYLVKLHDQFMQDVARKARNTYEKQYRKRRRKHKKALGEVLSVVNILLDWPENDLSKNEAIWKQIDRENLRMAYDTVAAFDQFTTRGYGHFVLNRYPSLRKYFAQYLHLPFLAATGSEDLLRAIEIVKKLDNDTLKQLPEDSPTQFIPKELRHLLWSTTGQINRNAWEMGLALAIKDAFRSGNLYLAQSKQHVSFWDLIIHQNDWNEIKEVAYTELEQPPEGEIISILHHFFDEQATKALENFKQGEFASIVDGKLKLKRNDKLAEDPKVKRLQKVIDSSMPFIRIEELLMEVDRQTRFTQHFKPIAGHASKPKDFYKTLIAAIVSQATNLGIVSMSASMKNTSVDKLRHVLRYFIREDTLKEANTQLVNLHHQLPLSSVYGKGEMSSSDAQRFGIRASSLLASYYPRYYGYYEKAIGLYTHISDQYAVYGTKAISCGPREALYVLDGLLENNTILNIKAHTTDTHGFTEIIFALCYLLGYDFMPRIRDLKDQQLYKTDKTKSYGIFDSLLNKTADVDIVEEQWDMMIRVASSLRKRTAPAHVVVQRLSSKAPSDRLTKAFIKLGRIIKTQYILRYITDPALRRTVQLQLNKGEYRHNLPRRIFFANQGEFTTGDYAEIMNKASCLSLVSNAVLYWNTKRINDLVNDLRNRGEEIDDENPSHISLLPYKHLIPNGSYFIEDFRREF
jgi:TnpA family transposase